MNGGGGQPFHHSFDFNFDDMFRDFDIYNQNRHARPKRHFDEHFRAHQQAHNRHKRHFQGTFGTGVFEDMFEDMEKMFTFERHIKMTEETAKQHCRTVTQRRGNMVTTYTDCTSSSWTSERTITLLFHAWFRWSYSFAAVISGVWFYMWLICYLWW